MSSTGATILKDSSTVWTGKDHGRESLREKGRTVGVCGCESSFGNAVEISKLQADRGLRVAGSMVPRVV